MVRHYMASGGKVSATREHTFSDPEEVANHVEDVLSPSEEAGEPKLGPKANIQEEAAEAGVERPSLDAQAKRARERRHNDTSPMGIGRKAPQRVY